MVEDHRRVEPRSIVGTGMATDPERVEQVADEAARRERATRAPPANSFSAVLVTAPARGDLEDAAPVRDPRRKPDDAGDNADNAANADDANNADTAGAAAAPVTTTAATEKAKATSSKPRPSLPDPRERLLREKFAKLQGAPASPSRQPGVTPPTGSSRIKK